MQTIPYYHVDVFSSRVLSGNGLAVFTDCTGFSQANMLRLTQEMRQYESIFLQSLGGNRVRAYIFSCQEEMDFAGHPVLGASAVLHYLHAAGSERAEWIVELNKKTVTVVTEKKGSSFKATMNQGEAVFGKTLKEEETKALLAGINLTPDDLYPGLFPTVVSTGLPYLIVPLRKNGYQAKILVADLEQQLHAIGASFLGILEIPTQRIRTGDNDGRVEDIATGSLAGPSAAFLVANGFQPADTLIRINQGENLDRPSQLFTELKSKSEGQYDVYVGGDVWMVSQNLLLPDVVNVVQPQQQVPTL